MFYICRVQEPFAFISRPLDDWHRQLMIWHGDPLPVPRRTPLGQLVKSIISARTRDAVSRAAYTALAVRAPSLVWLAEAAPSAVERIIAAVTFAESKARFLVEAMRIVVAERPDGRLDHLADLPLDAALAWLERLPGVARKVSASTLNASTLNRPVLIVDTHVLRVLARLGLVGERSDYRTASEAATAAMPYWSGDAFLRFHILAKRLGQTLCRWDVPRCRECPLQSSCMTAKRSHARRVVREARQVHPAFNATH